MRKRGTWSMKVLIADDEYMILEGLEHMVKWAENGYTVIGTSDNGAKAMEMIRRTRPDIVLTDIRMPGMSGLELIQESQKENIPCQFIVVSGYRDFEYCQDALQLGVSDYILKPIDFDAIIPKVDRIAQKLSKSFQKDCAILTYYFRSIFSGSEPPDRQSTDIWSILNRNLYYFVCIAQTDRPVSITSKAPFFLQMADQDMQVFVIGIASHSEIAGQVNLLKNDLSGQCTVLAFASGRPCLIDTISCSYQDAIKAMQNQVFYGMDRYPDTLPVINASDKKNLQDRITQMAEAVKSMNAAAALRAVHEYFELAAACKPDREYIIRNFCELYIVLKNLFDAQGVNIPPDFWQELEVIHKVPTLAKLEEYALETTRRLFAILSVLYADTHNPIKEIKEYIEEHSSEDISLSSVSNKFYFNPSYLSRLFREKANTTFTQYVNQVRIEKAKSMLLSSQSIEKTALTAGFSSYHYFTKIFHKLTGMTPQEYKKSALLCVTGKSA